MGFAANSHKKLREDQKNNLKLQWLHVNGMKPLQVENQKLIH